MQEKQSSLIPILVLSMGVSSLLYFLFKDWHFDDGMIIVRIVHNLREHGEWGFNPGEIHNASTGVLNTVIIFILSFITPSILIASNTTTAIAIALAGMSVSLLYRRSPFTISFGLVSATILMWGLGLSNTWGLESSLFIAGLLAFCVVEHRPWLSYFVLGLLILIRPDGIVVLALKFAKDVYLQRKIPWVGGMITLAIITPWLIFSWVTFGRLFPDTLTAKVWQGASGLWGHGHIYVKAFQQEFFSHPPMVYGWYGLAALGALSLLVTIRSFWFVIFFLVIQQCSYALLNVPGYHWYFTLPYIVLILCATHGALLLVQSVVQFRAISPMIVSVGLVLLSIGYTGYRFKRDGALHEVRHEAYTAAAYTIDTKFPDIRLLGTLEVGSIGAATKKQIVDLTGLATANPEFVSGKNNDAFFENPAESLLLHDPLWHFERGLADDIRFEFVYPESIAIPSATYPLRYFIRRQAIPDLSPSALRSHIEKSYPPFTPIAAQTFTPAAECIVDMINGVMKQGSPMNIHQPKISIRGWAVDTSEGTPEVAVLLTNSANQQFSLKGNRSERPDIITHLGSESYRMAGFEVIGSLLSLPPGDYSIKVLQFGKIPSACDAGVVIRITR